jgi:hypothetical protein
MSLAPQILPLHWGVPDATVGGPQTMISGILPETQLQALFTAGGGSLEIDHSDLAIFANIPVPTIGIPDVYGILQAVEGLAFLVQSDVTDGSRFTVEVVGEPGFTYGTYHAIWSQPITWQRRGVLV